MAEKGSKTMLHRGFTESIKNIDTEDNKAQKTVTQTFGRRWLYIEERQVILFE